MIPGEITEITGRRSSGRTSLLIARLAEVTRGEGIAALIDTDDALDVTTAARAGVVLRRLLWVRCGHRRTAALRALDALVRCRGFALVAWDVGERSFPLSLAAAFRLKLAARQSEAAVVIVASRRMAGAAAALAVEAHRRAAHWEGTPPLATRFAGMQAHYLTVRARRGPPPVQPEVCELSP
jgi:RecA/RadA recombinase